MLNSSAHSKQAILVTIDNFVRAETDRYFSAEVEKCGGLARIHHGRDIAAVDQQTVIRYNRDVLLSSAILDLAAGPATITLPDAGKRFFSILVISEDHYNPVAEFGGGVYVLSEESVGTRYAVIALRLFVDPNDPDDMAAAHKIQDGVQVEQPGGPGSFEIPNWEAASLDKLRNALLILASSMADYSGAFGKKDEVAPVKHLVATASGWGGNPESVAMYVNVTPAKNDGRTVYQLTVPAEVPVDGFWSVAVYNAQGYFQKNPRNAYNVNNITAKKNEDGTVTIQFGDCDQCSGNCLPIVDDWNYVVRLYRPRKEVLDGTFKWPRIEPLN